MSSEVQTHMDGVDKRMNRVEGIMEEMGIQLNDLKNQDNTQYAPPRPNPEDQLMMEHCLKTSQGLHLKIYIKGGTSRELTYWCHMLDTIGVSQQDCQIRDTRGDLVLTFSSKLTRDRFVPRIKAFIREAQLEHKVQQWLSPLQIHNKNLIYANLKPLEGAQLIDKGDRVHLLVRNDHEEITLNQNIWLCSSPDDASAIVTDLKEAIE